MIEGVFVLLFSMFFAVMIRIKSNKQACIIKKILPYLVLLAGGLLATLIVIVNK
jgi:hypothetical protein